MPLVPADENIAMLSSVSLTDPSDWWFFEHTGEKSSIQRSYIHQLRFNSTIVVGLVTKNAIISLICKQPYTVP